MDWLLLVACVMICELAGIIGSVFTIRAIPAWYARLKKPSFNPPSWIFGPAWTVLYALQGIAVYLIFQKAGNAIALRIFFIQLLLNAGWTPLFFGAKLLGAAFVEILVLSASIIVTIIVFSAVNVTAAWLMIPYALWVAFASALNYKIWRLNR